MFDAYGDGLAYGGGYSVIIDGELEASGGDFAFYEETNFNVYSPDESEDTMKADVGESCLKNRDCLSRKCERNTCCKKKGDTCQRYDECCSDSCSSGLCE